MRVFLAWLRAVLPLPTLTSSYSPDEPIIAHLFTHYARAGSQEVGPQRAHMVECQRGQGNEWTREPYPLYYYTRWALQQRT